MPEKVGSNSFLLIIEDNPADRRLLELSLPDGGITWGLRFADSLGAALPLASDPDCICVLADLGLPDCQGLEVVQRLRQVIPETALVVLTGLSDESVALEAIVAGAQEYLCKDSSNLTFLPRLLRHAVERQAFRIAIETGRRTAQALLDASYDAAWLLDEQGCVLACNAKACESVGAGSVSDLLGTMLFDRIDPCLAPGRRDRFNRAMSQRNSVLFDDTNGQAWYSNRLFAIQAGDNRQECAFFSRDVTAEHLAAHELSQAKDAAEQANRSKTEFITRIGRDVRMHLNRMTAELEGSTTDIASRLETIKREINCLVEVVDHINDVSMLETALLQHESFYRDLVELSPDLVCVCTDGMIDHINAAGLGILRARSVEAVQQHRFLDFIHPSSLGIFTDGIESLFTKDHPIPVKIQTLSGQCRDVELRGVPLRRDDETVNAMLVGRDITEVTSAIREISEREKRIRAIMDTVQDGIVTTDEADMVVSANLAVERMFGYAPGTLMGTSITSLIPTFAQYRDKVLEKIAEGEAVFENYGQEVIAHYSDGSPFPLHLSIAPLQLEHSRFFTSTLRDLSERKKLEKEVDYLANHDLVTELPNRRLLLEELGRMVGIARSRGAQVMVAIIDLVDFTTINDSLGHAAGNSILKNVAERLTKVVLSRKGVVARLTGDEFAIILLYRNDHTVIASTLEQIRRALARTFTVAGGDAEISLAADMGVAVFPRDGKAAMELVSNAEMALHHTKRSPNERIGFFNATMTDAVSERLALVHSLEVAIAQEQFELYYQPQIRLEDWSMVGVEALIRWKHPELGMIAPLRFVPLAEETGLIIPLGRWILQTACQQQKAWRELGLPPIRMGVNISGRQFHDHSLVDTVAKVLAESELEPWMLDLEMTESILMEDGENTLRLLRGLAQLGVHISIDDFGTGYSSLSYLKRFPVQTVKLDRSFICDLDTDEQARALAASIVSLAHSMSLSTIAEGVESAGEAIWLRESGCDEIQGYFAAKPMPADALTQFLQNYDSVERARLLSQG